MFGDKSLIGRGLDVLARLFGVSTPSGTARPRRIVIVSNRLPFNVRDDHGLLRYEESAGGLVTGISAYLESLPGRSAPPRSYQWVGWPGGTVDSSARAAVIAEARTRYQSHPVFLSFEEMEQFYHGFCNKTIWPLFHYFPTYAIYREEFWREYQKVNELFCDALLQIIREDDVVWIHDYHLMLLPAMVKAKVPAIPVGFFLHIPFPSFEVFRLLPGRWRRQLLEGMLGADLIGFHTYEYSQHFLQSVLRIVGHEHNLGYISLPTRVVRVETFPMGIDFQKFWSAVDLPEVQEERMALRKSLAASKVILSVDRLDYTKGIIDRLQGFETLLETQPKYREKVVLAMIVVPSRVAVEQYEMMKKQIEELVGKINGRFGSVHWTPVIYQYRAVPFRSLVAMYNASDIALVTPLRDGMNLVAKEYIATRIDQSGVLVLSEMAGAAKELSEAIVINPGNREEIAGALEEALEMPIEEQKRRNAIMQARLRRYTVLRWADDFIERLIELREVQVNLLAKLLPADDRRTMLNEYRNARHRLFLLDYDGTLVPFAKRPHLARPDEELLHLLRHLAMEPRNTIVLVSGRDRETMQQWFGALPIGLVAEHGVSVREIHQEWRHLKEVSVEWKSRILPILEMYADRLPGSMIEHKDHAIAWHYRTADPEQSRLLAGEVMDHLVQFTANIDVQILQGNKVIEVRNAGVTKGNAGLHWMGKADFEFILAVGDDWTDEDLFAVLPPRAYSIRVGVTSTRARYNLREVREVIRLLETLASA